MSFLIYNQIIYQLFEFLQKSHFIQTPLHYVSGYWIRELKSFEK